MRATEAKGQTVLILTAIVILAVMLRVGVAYYLGDSIVETRGGTYDQISYDALAQRVVDGHGFSFADFHWPYARADQPTAFWSYLYTSYLAGIYKVFGHHPLVARMVQAVLAGILTPWLTFRIARRVFDERVGIISAAIVAIYAYFLIYAGSLMSESLYIVAVLWCIDAAMRLAQATTQPVPDGLHAGGLPVSLVALELGIAFGIAILLRQTILLFLVVMFIWLLWSAWRYSDLRKMISSLVMAGIITTLILLPFIVRNYRVFDRVTMPNTNAGFTFFWSNHPIYETSFEAVLSPSHGVSYQELVPEELRDLNEAELDRALLKLGVGFVIEEPVRYVRLSLSRIPVYFLFWPTAESSMLSNISRVLSFGLFVPFMICGLILALLNLPALCTKCKEGMRCEDTILLLLFVFAYTVIHLASWANVRYRLPVDAFLIMFAAYAIDRIWARWFEPRFNVEEDPQI